MHSLLHSKATPNKFSVSRLEQGLLCMRVGGPFPLSILAWNDIRLIYLQLIDPTHVHTHWKSKIGLFSLSSLLHNGMVGNCWSFYQRRYAKLNNATNGRVRSFVLHMASNGRPCGLVREGRAVDGKQDIYLEWPKHSDIFSYILPGEYYIVASQHFLLPLSLAVPWSLAPLFSE